ncbi:MAG: fused MFS/spermidine synthase [Gallionella sp.]|nr:fused MFS/spermidine synthase [Gallionella sp.]
MRHTKTFIAYLSATAILCGALVMVIEVLGSRVIGPFFGVSLFVWTSLITVTMVALAGGYAIGGHLSDRRESPDWLYGIIILSGVLVILIPLLKAPILQISLQFGLRWGALSSAFLLFGPALFLLGCVSPYVVKIAAREMHNIGRTVGFFYAISTIGSVAGTTLTGFVLIAYLGVNKIFILTGCLLIGIGVVYFIFFRRKWVVAGAMILPFLFMPPESNPEKTMPDGTHVKRIAGRDSFYGDLKVIEYSFGEMRTREMVIDGFVQGGVDMSNGLSVYEYPYLLQFIPYALNPGGKSCLVIGLGAGVVPAWYQAQGISTEVVDIDPAVVDLAHNYFNFSRDIPVHIEDARYFMSSAKKQYDFLILDVFNGDTTPGHLLSIEAVTIAKQRMAPNGVFAVNLVGDVRLNTLMTASVVKTLQKVFDQVVVYPTFDPSTGNGQGNLEIFAYDGQQRVLQMDGIRQTGRIGNAMIHPMARTVVEMSMQMTPFAFPPQVDAIVLSDNYNPMDFFDLPIKEEVRRTIMNTTDWSILL